MPARPAHRAGSRPHTIVAWKGQFRVTWWWRGLRRGVGLPTYEVFRVGDAGELVLVRRGRTRMHVPDFSKLPKAAAKHGAWGKAMPHLCEWLCNSVYPDGKDIGKVQLQVRREGSIIRAVLKIEDQGGLTVSAVEDDPLSAIAALDVLLGSPQCPWQRDDYALGQKRGKK